MIDIEYLWGILGAVGGAALALAVSSFWSIRDRIIEGEPIVTPPLLNGLSDHANEFERSTPEEDAASAEVAAMHDFSDRLRNNVQCVVSILSLNLAAHRSADAHQPNETSTANLSLSLRGVIEVIVAALEAQDDTVSRDSIPIVLFLDNLLGVLIKVHDVKASSIVKGSIACLWDFETALIMGLLAQEYMACLGGGVRSQIIASVHCASRATEVRFEGATKRCLSDIPLKSGLPIRKLAMDLGATLEVARSDRHSEYADLIVRLPSRMRQNVLRHCRI